MQNSDSLRIKIYQRIIKLIVGTMLLGAMMAPSAHAKESEIYTKGDNLAVSGYDVVSYFTVGKPTKGDSAYQTQWKGAQWLFSSAENLQLFEGNPEKYAPQYGGYCAWAVARNKIASGSPKHWEIVDGKLYLNYNAIIKSLWSRNKQEDINNAKEFWPSLLAQ